MTEGNEALQQVLIHDSNVKSVAYNESNADMVVIFGGGSKWKYRSVKPELFENIQSHKSGLSVLEEIRHNNLVGIRLR